MRILILEDSQERNGRFVRALIGHSVVVTTDVAGAIHAATEEARFDMFLLDHDLCLEHYGGLVSGVPTGRDFARFAATELPKHKRPTMAVIHSLNDPGSASMEAELSGSGIATRRATFLQFDKIMSYVRAVEYHIEKRANTNNAGGSK